MRIRSLMALAFIGLAINALLGGVLLLLQYNIMAQEEADARDAATITLEPDGSLTYAGYINSANSRLLADAVHQLDGKITWPRLLYMGSFGGEYAGAEEMLRVVNENDLAPAIGKREICASACVYVFAYGERHIALPDALFLFHRAKKGDLRWDQKLVNIIARKRTEAPSVLPENVMRTWAAQISPRLVNFFDSCSVDPTTTEKGLWLRWAEIEEIATGFHSHNCDSLMTRDREWVSRFRNGETE